MTRNNTDFALSNLHRWDQMSLDDEELGGAFHSPEWCKGVCVDAAESLAKFISKDLGVKASSVDATHIETGKPHTVTKVGDYFVDYTRRQFEPKAAIPTVEHKDEFLKKFRVR